MDRLSLTELEALLSAHEDDTKTDERTAFDRLSNGRPVVLMGAGGLGRRVLDAMKRRGDTPLAFADNSPSAQGTTIDGVAVLSPADAARAFGHRATFVVSIWGANRPHRFEHSQAQLRALGCDVVCSFPSLLWKYSDDALPFYLQDLPSRVLDEREDVLKAWDIWSDDASRTEYVSQVRLRVKADFSGLAHPVQQPQYFPDDLFTWPDRGWIVDGGAFDGDTVRAVTQLHGDRFEHILALEPDPTNFTELLDAVAALPEPLRARVDCRQMAVAAHPSTLYLNPSGTAASSARATPDTHTIAVRAEAIDDLVGTEPVSFIKLDIEGGEIEALHGARRVIERDAPVLAICVYHQQNHLWRIPLLLSEWRKDYALFLRPHNEEGWDLVCYAVPRGRMTRSRT